VEGGDLVVVQVGGDEALGGEGAGDLGDVGTGQTKAVEALEVGPASSPTVAMISGSPPRSLRL